MILTQEEILARFGTDIFIEPFDMKNLNPNSYNLCLGEKLLVYQPTDYLDARKDNPVNEIDIGNSCIVLKPGILYLGQTMEWTSTKNLVPIISGRSSIGRLGLCVHVTAGYGDIGFTGHWTLEMTVVHPLMVYPGLPLCQIYYNEIQGKVVREYEGKYQDNRGVQPSMLWKESPNPSR